MTASEIERRLRIMAKYFARLEIAYDGDRIWRNRTELTLASANYIAGNERCRDLWNKGMESTCDDRDRLKQENRRLQTELDATRPILARLTEGLPERRTP